MKCDTRPSSPNILAHSVLFKMADETNNECPKKDNENITEEKPQLDEAISEMQDDAARDKVS